MLRSARDYLHSSIRVYILAAVMFWLAVVFGPMLVHAQQSGPIPNGTNQGNFGPPIQTNLGHVSFGGGAAPSINAACGTNPQGPVGTDSSFNFISGTGTGATCSITPAIAWNKKPSCSLESQGGSQPAFQVSASGVIILSGVADSTAYSVICIGQPGG